MAMNIHPFAKGCTACAHHHPDPSGGYCAGNRPDLLRARGTNPPLRHLPPDDGAHCNVFAWGRALADRSCLTCRHLRRVGLAGNYCASGRDDLPLAYGANHPLRKLPADGGEGCPVWALAPRLETQQ